MTVRGLVLGGVALCLALAGCVHQRTPYQPPGQETAWSPIGDEGPLPYPRAPVPYDNHVVVDDPALAYRVRRLTIPSSGENGQEGDRIEALYYQSRSPGPRRMVIVLPIWGSYNYPSDTITDSIRFRSNGGTHVLRVLGERYVLDWKALGEAPTPEAFQDLMARMARREGVNIVDVSRLVDWARARPEVDPERIGLVGFSHGAIIAAMAAVNDPRIHATVLVMGGAHPHRILATCGGRVGELREKILRRFGWTVEEYQSAIEPLYRPFDVARYPGRVDPASVLVVDSARDGCIPDDARQHMWEALGRPERISLAYGHRMAFMSMTPLGFYWMRREIFEFLDARL